MTDSGYVTPKRLKRPEGKTTFEAMEHYGQIPDLPYAPDPSVVIKPYEPSIRDRVAQWLMGDGRPSPERRRVVEGLVGTSGLGDAGFSLADVTPAGPLFEVDESIREGDYQGAALGIMPLKAGRAARAVEHAFAGGGKVKKAIKALMPEPPAYPHLRYDEAPRPSNATQKGEYKANILQSEQPPAAPVDGPVPTGSMNMMDDVPVTFRGKEPWQFTPEEWHAFGKQYGLDNIGPADEAAWRAGHQQYPAGDKQLTVPGGVESEEPFTYYDLLFLKSQGIDPSQLDRATHAALQRRLAGTVTPEQGNQLQAFNGFMFGMTSPNNPLFPNQQAMSRLRARSPDDIARLADSIPWKYGEEVDPAVRAEYDRKIAETLGLGAGPNKDRPYGGLGARGSADYTRVAEFAQMFRDRPDFFMRREDEPWDHFIERVSSQTPGLSLKTGSFSGVWQDTANAEISAIDRHMANQFKDKLFATPEEAEAFKFTVLDRWNRGVGLDKGAKPRTPLNDPDTVPEAFMQDQLLQLVGQHKEPKALVTSRKRETKGQIFDNPEVPAHLQRESADWVQQPDKVLLMSDAYRLGLGENARLANEEGLSLFPSQWLNWDRIRRRLEPHENMFPGLEKLPPMSLKQHQGARETHWANGEMRYDKVDTPDGERLIPTDPVRNPSRLGYFSIPAAVGAGALATDEGYQTAPTYE